MWLCVYGCMWVGVGVIVIVIVIVLMKYVGGMLVIVVRCETRRTTDAG